MQNERNGGEVSLNNYFKLIKPKQIFSFLLILAFLFGGVFVLIPNNAKALLMIPSGTLSGTIRNTQTGSFLANTAFNFNGQSVPTDVSGHYSYSVYSCGDSNFTLTISLVGYDTKKIANIDVPCLEKLNLDIELSPVPDWRKDIQPGDILYDPYSFGVGHVALYIGDGQVVEAEGDFFHMLDYEKNHVMEDPITEWDYPNRTDAYLLRVIKTPGLSEEQWQGVKNNAIQFAIDQEGKPYDWHWYSKNSDHDASSWYCSELVWAAYYNQGIDLEYYHDIGNIISPVSPVEIFLDNDVYQVSSHLAHQSFIRDDISYLFVFSPIDVTVTDDSGNITNKDTLGIPGAFIIHNDIDPTTGHFHDTFVLPNNGNDYHLSVVKKSDAAPDATYTLVWETNGNQIVLAQNQIVPAAGQTVNYQVSLKPVVQDLNAVTDEDKSVDIALAGSDIYGEPLTYSIVSNPSHGSLNVAGNIATYLPELNYNGPDSFTYKASDGTNDSNIATVNIVINSVPDISAESFGNATENSVTITWATDEPATSRVIYDTISHASLGSAPNYGYPSSTVEDPTKVISHSVTVSSLSPGTTYYFRAISHGSSEVDSNEIVAKTNTPSPAIGKGRIIGRAYEDHDGDGKIDLVDLLPGLSGWTIYLDANDNGKMDNGEASVTTGILGFYQFNNLPAGNFTVREVPKSGWLQTYPKGGKYAVTLAANQTVLAKSFGNFKMGAISGTIFEDKNGNGHFDKGEGGLAGWTIQLVKPDGTITTTTGGNDGKYSFINLSPGNYKVSEVQQTGWQQTTSNPFGIKINSGTNSTGNDFGNRKR